MRDRKKSPLENSCIDMRCEHRKYRTKWDKWNVLGFLGRKNANDLSKYTFEECDSYCCITFIGRAINVSRYSDYNSLFIGRGMASDACYCMTFRDMADGSTVFEIQCSAPLWWSSRSTEFLDRFFARKVDAIPYYEN